MTTSSHAGRRDPRKPVLPHPRKSTTTENKTSTTLPILTSRTIPLPSDLRDSTIPTTNPWTGAAKSAAHARPSQKAVQTPRQPASNKPTSRSMESKKQTTKPPTKKSWANVVGGVTSDVSKPMLEPKTPAPKQTEKPHAATSWANVAKGGQANSKDSSKPAARDDKAVSTKATNAQPPISSTSVAKAAPSPFSAF